MSVRIKPSICRLAFSLFVAVSISVPSFGADHDFGPCDYNDELCGWIDEPVDPDPAPQLTASQPTAPQPTEVNATFATIANAIGSQHGVSFQQWVEPFAMVGPYLEDSLQMVRAFDQWWTLMSECFGEPIAISTSPDTAESGESESTEVAIAAIAKLEPVDIESYGPSVLQWESDADRLAGDKPPVAANEPRFASACMYPGVEVTPIDRLVGSSAIIATIDEPYMPYDMSVADLRLRSHFPVRTEAFCVRSRAAQWNPVPMRSEVQYVTMARQPSKPAFYPVECCFEEWIATLDRWTESKSSVRLAAEPQSIGRRLGELVLGSGQVVHRLTDLIATRLPSPVTKPSSSGLALLMRAGATETAEIDTAAPTRIAESVNAPLIR